MADVTGKNRKKTNTKTRNEKILAEKT